MKTLHLTEQAPSIEEILRMARHEGVLLQSRDGEQFFLSKADEFAVEVDLLRKHHDFLAFLDECKSDDSTISLEDIERQYR